MLCLYSKAVPVKLQLCTGLLKPHLLAIVLLPIHPEDVAIQRLPSLIHRGFAPAAGLVPELGAGGDGCIQPRDLQGTQDCQGVQETWTSRPAICGAKRTVRWVAGLSASLQKSWRGCACPSF